MVGRYGVVVGECAMVVFPYGAVAEGDGEYGLPDGVWTPVGPAVGPPLGVYPPVGV